MYSPPMGTNWKADWKRIARRGGGGAARAGSEWRLPERSKTSYASWSGQKAGGIARMTQGHMDVVNDARRIGERPRPMGIAVARDNPDEI